MLNFVKDFTEHYIKINKKIQIKYVAQCVFPLFSILMRGSKCLEPKWSNRTGKTSPSCTHRL